MTDPRESPELRAWIREWQAEHAGDPPLKFHPGFHSDIRYNIMRWICLISRVPLHWTPYSLAWMYCTRCKQWEIWLKDSRPDPKVDPRGRRLKKLL